MRRLFVLTLLLASILSGCAEKELSYSEISIDQAPSEVKNFIETIDVYEESNGIRLFVYDGDVRYLYLDKNFLKSGKGFGSFDVKTDESSWNMYLTEETDGTKPSETYKLYKITLDKSYEYMKVFKNGEETHLQIVGV